MGFLSRIKAIRAALVIEPDSVSNPTGWLGKMLNAMQSHSGVTVTEETQLGVSDWYKCTRVISESVAMLPLKIYRDLGEGKGRQEAKTHPLYSLLHAEPNPHMTSFTWLECMLHHLVGWGRHASYIERDGFGNPIALWPIAPNKCRWEVRDGVRWFWVRIGNGGEVRFWEDEILWIPGLTKDGYNTYTPVQLHREALGIAKAIETYSAKFFGNGGRLMGTLNHPDTLSKEAAARLKESFKEKHGSLDSALELMVLEEGLKFNPLSTPPNEAQFIETRNWMRGEMAGLHRVPPHKIGDLSKSTNNNIEQQDLEFLRDCLMPWLVRIEQAMNRCLLMPREKKRFYIKFVVKGLMRGDTAARTAYYKAMWSMAVMSPNMIAEAEDENPVDHGDRLYVQAGFIPVDKVDEVIAKVGMTNPAKPKEENGGDK